MRWVLGRNLGTFVAVAVALAGSACKGESGGGGPGGGERPLVGGLGTAIAPGASADLRLSPDGKFTAFLMNAEKPRLEGVPSVMVLGELFAAPVSGGAKRKVGSSVTNLPGGYLFSPDSKWLLLLSGYNPAAQQGELLLVDLTGSGEPTHLGQSVTYMLVSPDSKWLAFVDGGVLKVGAIGKGPYPDVAGEVATVEFAPDVSFLLFKRRLSAAAALVHVPIGKWTAGKKLAEQVGEYVISPDSKRVAFSQHIEAKRGALDLFVATVPALQPKPVASSVVAFAFTPDSKWLGRIDNAPPDQAGDFWVGPAEGGAGQKLGEKVKRFQFSPDSTTVAIVDKYDGQVGALAVAKLPDGKPQRLGVRVPNFLWSADGKYLAFLSRFLKPVYSVDLMLYPVGAAEPVKQGQGVFGYGFTPKSDYLLYRTTCIREGRACDLYAQDLGKRQEPAKKIVEGLYSFKTPEQGGRILVTYARYDSDTYDVAVYNLASGVRKTLDQNIRLPAMFAGPDGSKVAYIVADRDRAGVYVANEVP